MLPTLRQNDRYGVIMTDKALLVNAEVNPSGVSHGFDTNYAIAYGVDEAIMIRNLQFFITANANRGQNFHEGRFWSYDRNQDFPSHFPYWNVDKCRRIVESLVEQGVIIKGNFNKRWSDRTTWYAFKDQEKFITSVRIPKTPAPIMPVIEQQEIKEISPDLANLPNDNWQICQMTIGKSAKCIYDTSTIPSAISSSSSLKVPEDEPANAESADAAEEISIDPPKPKRVRTPADFSPKIREVGEQMLNCLVRSKPNYVPPRSLAPFLTHVDYLLRLDKRDPQLIIDVLSWALADHFWADKMYKPNPAEYLRKQFDQLEMKMNAKPAPKDRKFAPSSNDAAAIAKMEEMSRRAI